MTCQVNTIRGPYRDSLATPSKLEQRHGNKDKFHQRGSDAVIPWLATFS